MTISGVTMPASGGKQKPIAPPARPSRPQGADAWVRSKAVKAKSSPTVAATPSVGSDVANVNFLLAPGTGLRPLLRLVHSLLNKGNTLSSTAGTASRFNKVLEAAPVAFALKRLPDEIGHGLQGFAKGPTMTRVGAFARTPMFVKVARFFGQAAPFAGLLCAPFDVISLRQALRDPRASNLHKVRIATRTIAGLGMCALGVLAWTLPMLGHPAAGVAAATMAGRFGLLNLAVSIPDFVGMLRNLKALVQGHSPWHQARPLAAAPSAPTPAAPGPRP